MFGASDLIYLGLMANKQERKELLLLLLLLYSFDELKI